MSLLLLASVSRFKISTVHANVYVCSGLKTFFSDIPSSQVGIVGEWPGFSRDCTCPCVCLGPPILALPVVNTFTLTSWSVQVWSFFRRAWDTPSTLVEGNHCKLKYILTRFCGTFPSQRFDLSASRSRSTGSLMGQIAVAQEGSRLGRGRVPLP